jgi:hypothetical protein
MTREGRDWRTSFVAASEEDGQLLTEEKLRVNMLLCNGSHRWRCFILVSSRAESRRPSLFWIRLGRLPPPKPFPLPYLQMLPSLSSAFGFASAKEMRIVAVVIKSSGLFGLEAVRRRPLQDSRGSSKSSKKGGPPGSRRKRPGAEQRGAPSFWRVGGSFLLQRR